jgi:hypothetical protein
MNVHGKIKSAFPRVFLVKALFVYCIETRHFLIDIFKISKKYSKLPSLFHMIPHDLDGIA